jgi:DNA-binding GntR family transcriptional regulator
MSARKRATSPAPAAAPPIDEKPRPLLVKTTLAERAYEILKERILDQDVAPGTRLNIDALARETGVSTSPLREALAKLEADRLVVSELYSGYTVAPEPSIDYLGDLLDFRTLIEGHCALIGARRDNAKLLDEMRATIDDMGATRRLGTRYKEYRRFVAADSRFHQLIVDSAGNQVASDTYSSMNAIMLQARLYLHRSSGKERAAEVSIEHARILQAFKDHDGAAAKRALEAHLQGGKRRLLLQT